MTFCAGRVSVAAQNVTNMRNVFFHDYLDLYFSRFTLGHGYFFRKLFPCDYPCLLPPKRGRRYGISTWLCCAECFDNVHHFVFIGCNGSGILVSLL